MVKTVHSLRGPRLHPSHKSRAPTGRYITASFMIHLGSAARWTSETGSTRPGKKWQLLLASCTDHKRWKKLPCTPKPASLKMPAHPAQQGRSFKEHSRPLSRSLSSPAWCANPPGHRWGHCLSCAQLRDVLAVQLPALPFMLLLPPAPSPSSFWRIGLILQTGTERPKCGKGPAVHCLEVKAHNCFSWNTLQISHPFFPLQMWKRGTTACTKGYFHTCRQGMLTRTALLGMSFPNLSITHLWETNYKKKKS